MELPLFPGYLFCRFDFNQRLPILTTPGVINVVRLGSQPQPVPQHEIAALETVVRSGMLLRPWPFLKAGQRVVIQEGPLRNVEGLLSEIKGHNQLIVSISLLQRSVAVNIERACVRPIAS
jgi:transcription antitermination factor NusG